jgi:hypothetical protein
MTKTTAYNVGVGMIVAIGSFTYGFGTTTHLSQNVEQNSYT